ncbi:MAG TPA: hypothetical protein VGO47_03160, partial [Chlamydiales bacterium]|nr:hypothetical protein [Chlamydiales bacterium]
LSNQNVILVKYCTPRRLTTRSKYIEGRASFIQVLYANPSGIRSFSFGGFKLKKSSSGVHSL